MLPKLSLQFKLPTFFILVATLPLAVTGFLWFLSFREEIITVSSSEVKSAAAQAAETTEGFFTAKLISLITHSQTEAVLGEDLAKAATELKNFLFQDQDIKELTLLNAEGFEVLKVDRSKAYAASELVDRSSSTAFKVATFIGGDRYTSPVYEDRDGDLVVDIAVAVVAPEVSQNLQSLTTSAPGRLRQPGEIKGILIEKTSLKNFFQSLGKIKIGQTGYVFLVDDKGILLNHPKVELLGEGRDLKGVGEVDKFLEALTSGITVSAVVSQSQNELGETALTTHEHIRPTNWGVIAQVPLADTLAATNRIALFAVLLFVIVLIFVVLLSLQLSEQIVQPIRQLQRGSRIIGGGNLAHRMQITTGDEIEELANSFNSMAAGLQEAFQKVATAKDVIAAERNKLAVVLSGIVDAVVAVDLERKILIFNKAAENLTGFASKEVLGERVDKVFRVYDNARELRAEEFCPIRTDGFEGVVFAKKELRVVGREGKEAFVNLLAGQIREGERIGLGSILTLHDITQEKKLEAMKVDFVSMAAHELRTPLTSLKGYLSVFINENKERFSEQQGMFLNRISASADRLGALVEDLLSVTGIERGTLTLDIAPTDWLAIVRPIVRDFVGRAREKKIELTMDEPSEPLPMVMADKLRIGEVLSNLLANAVNFTNPGGKIKVSFSVKNGELITSVTDTGVGIPKESIPHLFTKFYRASGALEKTTKGTGLGLYISKSIVDLHKGRIWVESKLGKGSVFSFSLKEARQV